MKLGIIGSRSYSNYDQLCEILRLHFAEFNDYGTETNGYNSDGYRFYFDEIISGGAQGADSLAAKFARQNNIKLTEFLPDWENLGKAAGMIRNEKIISESNFVLAFYDGYSPGTKNSLNLARKMKKPTMIIYF